MTGPLLFPDDSLLGQWFVFGLIEAYLELMIFSTSPDTHVELSSVRVHTLNMP